MLKVKREERPGKKSFKVGRKRGGSKMACKALSPFFFLSFFFSPVSVCERPPTFFLLEWDWLNRGVIEDGTKKKWMPFFPPCFSPAVSVSASKQGGEEGKKRLANARLLF
jgi:hypothetical protein